LNSERHSPSSPMAHAMMHLAEAHALIVSGSTRTFTAPKLAKAGRPLPWVLGIGTPTVIAEPWSHLHKLHRRKRGFRAICDRLQVLIDSVHATSDSSALTLQVWEDEGTIDRPLLEKVGRQVEQPIQVWGPEEIRETLRLVKAGITEDRAQHHNPLLAVLGWLSGWNY